MNEEIFFVAMDSYDTTLVQEVWTKNPKIKDEYGVSVGLSIDSGILKSPNLKFHSDLHYNIYGTVKGSKIEYRLIGDFKILSDTSFVADDLSVKKWQVENMTIEYLIWRK
jgi:hypothetical protein